jgi:hypothetical protein
MQLIACHQSTSRHFEVAQNIAPDSSHCIVREGEKGERQSTSSQYNGYCLAQYFGRPRNVGGEYRAALLEWHYKLPD